MCPRVCAWQQRKPPRAEALALQLESSPHSTTSREIPAAVKTWPSQKQRNKYVLKVNAPALSALSHASNLDWRSVSHMIIHMFQCYSLKPSHHRLLPQSPKDCSRHLCLFCCLTYRVIMGRAVGGGFRMGTHVYPWLIHVNGWQKPLQYCKVISLRLK